MLLALACLLGAHPALASFEPGALVEAARAQTLHAVVYDGSYRRIDYPGGDVPADRGVCTDVVIRAYRRQQIDLQQRVHEDMRRDFSAYPALWGLSRPDANIDHRRVPNLQKYLARQRAELPAPSPERQGDLRPGDLITWMLPGNLPHIGIVSDRRARDDTRPLILHNIGAGVVEDDILVRYPITGHYRYPIDAPSTGSPATD